MPINIRQALKRGRKKRNWEKQGGLSTKIHAIVDAYGYQVYFALSEGQESAGKFAIPVLSEVGIDGSDVLADKGCDADKIIDYIYDNGGEPTTPSKSNRTFQRQCDRRLYKERHLVECFSKNSRTTAVLLLVMTNSLPFLPALFVLLLLVFGCIALFDLFSKHALDILQ